MIAFPTGWRRIVAGASICCALGADACKKTSAPTASATANPGEIKSFPIRGKIVRVDAAKGSIVLNHDAVPGFMGAMTMQYKLKDASIAGELHAGDAIAAKLLVRKAGDDFEDAMLDQVVVVGQARPDYKPQVQYHVPTAGDEVPDFRLVNQDGRAIHFKQFKGRAVLLTFIYTRCPLADYCPRMNKNFAEIEKALASDSAVYAKTHLLSVSFDPHYDTPSILKSYGGIYTGGEARTFAHWDFAATPEDELAAVEQYFDLGVTPGESGTLNHSLSTAVVGKDGRVRVWYPTNDWTVAEVLGEMKKAARE